MLEDKAMIIIAVSNYTGSWPSLPGAITSAKRMREWAEQPGEDCNYKVLYLADDIYNKIDVQLIIDKVHEFIQANFIDRLVVYFAGHGIVRSAGDQFWLLTDAENDIRQGIDVEPFIRGLTNCNIGRNDLAGQLCIIADACRNTGRDAINFRGDPILTTAAKRRKAIQLDRFLSTGLGDYSFQINATDSQCAYCLFSELLLHALRGEVAEAIDTEDHRFKPVVTNHKLAEYLEKAVSQRAAAIQEVMIPDLLTGIHPPYNYYKRLEGPIPRTLSTPYDRRLVATMEMAIRGTRSGDNISEQKTVEAKRRQALSRLKDKISGDYSRWRSFFNESGSYYYERSSTFLTLSDFEPSHVAIPLAASVQMGENDGFCEIVTEDCFDAPILVQQKDGQWIIAPNYPNVVSIVSHDLPGDILFLRAGYSVERDELLDAYLSDFSNLAGNVPLRAADAQRFADRIRVGKEDYPHQAVTAGYLYEFSNDYDNIGRTAHYMASNTGSVPFDLALLCADKIWWSREDGRITAFANLPDVPPFPPNGSEMSRPFYSTRAFNKKLNVPLWGIAPIFGHGWKFMQTELYLEIPDQIRQISEHMNGRSAASLTPKGLELFMQAFEYQVVDIEAMVSQIKLVEGDADSDGEMVKC